VGVLDVDIWEDTGMFTVGKERLITDGKQAHFKFPEKYYH
jgi:hypothetical protein